MLSIINSGQLSKYQRGAITVTVSLLLMALSLMGAMYTVKTKLFDIRIANSELRKNQATISAEAGLQRGIAQLDVMPSALDSIVDEVLGTNQYTVDFNRILDGGGEPLGHPNWDNDRIIEITATGISDDNSAVNVLSQKVWIHPLVRSAPNSPMTVDGTVDVGGNFTIGAAPNGGGLGVPLSVWTSNSADLTGSGVTCALEEFDNAECGSYNYSDKTDVSSDILLDTLVSTGGSFPDDLFEHTFGVPRAEYQTIKDEAEQILTNCSSLNSATTGLIWVTDDCDTSGQIGTEDKPVILVVENADFKMNAGDVLYGVIYTFDAVDSGVELSIQLNGGASVFGAFISDYDAGKVNGTYNLRYDPDVLANIAEGSLDVFTRIETIPGSWKDF